MKKFLLIALFTISFIGSSVAQMAIPGAVFASKPASFNGRQVTIKNIQLDFSSQKVHGFIGPVAPVGGPGAVSVGPGPVGSPTAPATTPCNPPRGFKKLDVIFLEVPEVKYCFFMKDAMYTELERQSGHQNVDAQITFRGDARMGYNVTFYKIGR